ncbi:methionyl-tRNA formyltransferase [Ramlibacter sp. AN1133]|uniref:methionyl-tRNA formyltransferase n=1 Tax=Ramlibacter sp. AN1133 TaxID=3133429 RepID=UPI0030C4330B
MTPRLRVAVIGRTEMLLEAGRRIAAAGHSVPLVATCAASDTSAAGEEDFRRFADEVGADYFCSAAINAPAQLARLQAAQCSLAMSMNWLTLIGPQARAAFPQGVFNAHPGDLPRYRGNACPNWAILAGEPSVGLCIHQMADALDAGPVALRDRLPLDDGTDVEQVYDWLRRRIPEMYLALVESVAAGTLQLQPQPQDPALSLRCYPRRREDGRIDWSRPAAEVHRLVRASTRPAPGAYSLLEGTRPVTIWRAAVVPSAGPFLAVPGQVCRQEQGDPVIACGDGMLRLLEVDVEGCAGGADAKAAILRSLRNRLV